MERDTSYEYDPDWDYSATKALCKYLGLELHEDYVNSRTTIYKVSKKCDCE